jgi:hypothetical protein
MGQAQLMQALAPDGQGKLLLITLARLVARLML